MRLRFGPDDVEAFASIKQQLIDEFRPWADEHCDIIKHRSWLANR